MMRAGAAPVRPASLAGPSEAVLDIAVAEAAAEAVEVAALPELGEAGRAGG